MSVGRAAVDPWYGELVPRPRMTRPLVRAFAAIDPGFLRIDSEVWDYEVYREDALCRGERRRGAREHYR